MSEISYNQAGQTENGRRLHAIVRAALSLGIWLVLAAQITLVFSLNWRVRADASPGVSVWEILPIAAVLTVFLYLQAGAFHALTRGRNSVSVIDVLRAGKSVFADFVWLSLKACLLFFLIMNVLLYLALIISGKDLKVLIDMLSPFFSLMISVLSFMLVYWLPFVFVQREFRLLPGLRAGLKIAWSRLASSAYLALLVFLPTIISHLLPTKSPWWVDVMLSVIGGLMGWIAYIYCVERLQEQTKNPVYLASV
jgi:hypothetical protein